MSFDLFFEKNNIKLIIAGSRTITDIDIVKKSLNKFGFNSNNVVEIISGGANGVDTLGERIANIWNIPVVSFPAEWDRLGINAGKIRNTIMAKYCTHALIVWDGHSNGSFDMIKKMKDVDKPYYVELV